MKTSVKTYKRGDKQITLLGVCHIGSKNYYNKIQKELDKNVHEKVLFEGVKGFDKFDLNKFYNFVSNILGLSSQKLEIKYKKEWVRSDLDFDVLNCADSNFIPISEDSFKSLKDIDNLTNEDIDDLKENKYIKLVIPFIFCFIKLKSFFKRKTKPVILDLRNYKVLIDCFKYLVDNDRICVFYGDAHLHGIEKYIKRVGFKKVEQYKINVLR